MQCGRSPIKVVEGVSNRHTTQQLAGPCPCAKADREQIRVLSASRRATT